MSFDPAPIHALLNKTDKLYHTTFDGHVADEVHRFEQFLETIRMIVDQSAISAGKE